MSNSWFQLVKADRAIAIIRSPSMELGLRMALAVADGGMRLIEITWNSDQAGELIARLRRELPECMIGTGTLLNLAHLTGAIAAGAQFFMTPHVDLLMIQTAVKLGLPIIPGALTPSEIVSAHQYGATCVKVFPVHAMGGAGYIKSLQGPLGDVPLIPTGGVTVENAADFILAGAVAVGLSTDLFPQHLTMTEDWQAIARRIDLLHRNLS